MMYEALELQASLAAAVGDDSLLVAELKVAFVEGAQRYFEQLAKAPTDSEWIMAALKLQGLAASFGVDALMVLASEASEGMRGDPSILKPIRKLIAELRD